MKKVWLFALLALMGSAQAQTGAAKKELVAKVLQLQQPVIEQTARSLAERPAVLVMQQAARALQTRIAADKREALGKEIQADVKKYVDAAVPLVREHALKLAPTTLGTMLEERFTEDELKQLITIMESPVNRKFAEMGGEMHKVLVEKLVAETKGAVEPKMKTLEQSVSKRLGLPLAPAGAASGAARPAKAASK